MALPDMSHAEVGSGVFFQINNLQFLNVSIYRELKAASGEWVDAGDPAEISEVLLTQMRRAAIEKEKQEEQKSTTGPREFERKLEQRCYCC